MNFKKMMIVKPIMVGIYVFKHWIFRIATRAAACYSSNEIQILSVSRQANYSDANVVALTISIVRLAIQGRFENDLGHTISFE